MKHHRDNSQATSKQESFLKYDDEPEILYDIYKWWEGKKLEDPNTNIEVIVFRWTEDGCNADVHYTSISQELADRIVEIATEPRIYEITENTLESQQN